MHQHQMVAQVLLILFILNSVLAAPAVTPAVTVREIPGERGVVVVRVPAEGVVAVLEKRPFEPEWETSAGPSLEHPEPQSTRPSEIEIHDSSPEEMNSPEPTPPPRPPPRPVPKKTSTRPKIMTPEKIKATKIITGIGVLTMAVLGLVDIHIMFQHSNSPDS